MQKDPKSKDKGCNGHHKVKFHALQFFIHYMRKYGSSINFDTSACEEQHKSSVTRPGGKTQRRKNNFVGQTLLRNSENDVVDLVYSMFDDEMTPLSRHYYTHDSRDRNSLTGSLEAACGDSNCEVVPSGRYALWCHKTNHDNRANPNQESDVSILWADNIKNRGQISVHKGICQGLAGWASLMGFDSGFEVTGYTAVTVKTSKGNIIYRATECLHGNKRYDWALVRDPPTGKTYIGHIFGFFRYVTPGFPTYKLVELDHLPKEQIMKEGLTDDTLYVALWGSARMISEETLLEHIATPFEMHKKAHVYVLPASAIVRPLAVAPDFGADDSRSFINVLPQKDWGRIFKRLIMSFMDGGSDGGGGK